MSSIFLLIDEILLYLGMLVQFSNKFRKRNNYKSQQYEHLVSLQEKISCRYVEYKFL